MIKIIILIIASIAFSAGGTEKYNIKELSRSEDTQLRKAAVSRMYLLKDVKFIPDIIKALEDKDPVVRKIAIYASERINDKTFIPPVIKLLEDPDNGVKAAAIIALGKFEDVSAAPALINALKKETFPDMKTAIIRSLGSIRSKEAVPYIIEALGDKKLSEKEDVWDYTEALNVVLKEYFNDRNVIPVLKGLLENRSIVIACQAALGLLKFDDRSGVPVFIKSLGEDDYRQQAALLALSKVKESSAVDAIIKGPLENENYTNRAYSVDALGEIGGEKAIEGLKAFLTKEKDYALRKKAVKGLKKLGVSLNNEEKIINEPGPAKGIPVTEEKKEAAIVPQFIIINVDDASNIEGMENILEIAETLKEKGTAAPFVFYSAPGNNTQPEKLKLIYQRLFDLGAEFANHTLHHNRGGNWFSVAKEKQIEEIEGCTKWLKDNISGFDNTFCFKTGGGGNGTWLDREFSLELLNRQNFEYGASRGSKHPDEQKWPVKTNSGKWMIDFGIIDGNAPPVHSEITRVIRSDYAGNFDYEIEEGVKMLKANFEYRYFSKTRPVLAVNACHDWGFKTEKNSSNNSSHKNEKEIIKQFLLDVLVVNKTKYPGTYCITAHELIKFMQGKDIDTILKERAAR